MESFHRKIQILATTIIVLTCMAIGLYWAKSFVRVWLSESSYQSAIIQPSGLLPKAIENDPNTAVKSKIIARTHIVNPVGISNLDERSLQWEAGLLSFDLGKNGGSYAYFNKKTGLIEYWTVKKLPDENGWDKTLLYCFGPKGIAKKGDEKLGRFIQPIPNDKIYYDKSMKQFFKLDIKYSRIEGHRQLDFENSTVRSGPKIGESIRDIIQIGNIAKKGIYLKFEPPQRKTEDGRGSSLGPSLDSHMTELFNLNKELVLNADGAIYMLDTNSLEIEKQVGRLPMGPTFMPTSEEPTARNLLAYGALPLVVDGQYKGLFAAGVSRDNTGVTLAAYDPNGIATKTDWSRIRGVYQKYDNPSIASKLYLRKAGGPLVLTIKYLVENLYPTATNLLSYFCSDSFEAAKGYSKILIMPDTYAAMLGREPTDSNLLQFFGALGIISPSILLGVFLGWWVCKDAKGIGIGQGERYFWFYAAIALGPCGYITYRLTRPKEILVTCKNCGRLRRPDEERCHNCSGAWTPAGLKEPLWEVRNLS